MTVAVIFAGGAGVRMGASVPKQFLEIAGKPVLAHTLQLFQSHAEIDGIVLVVQREYFKRTQDLCLEYGISKVLRTVNGGVSAQDSIYNGLRACRDMSLPDDTVVLIHDGVRPYITPEVISANISSVKKHGNGITFTPCYETLIISRDGQSICDIPPRRESYSAQAPQSFRLGDIFNAHEKVRAMPGGYTDLVDQATLLWKLGIPIHLVPGNRGNIKITTPEDIAMLDALLRNKEEHQ